MFGRSPHDYYFGTENDPFGYSLAILASNHSNISVDGSCSDVLSKDWSDRCYFVQNNDNCQDVDGFINYVSILYCTFGKSLFPLAIIIYIVWLLVLFIALAVSADDYFCPSIEVISKVLRLSQNIAGVTIMALGNGAPDIFSALAGIGQDRPELVFGELIGAGVFLTTVVAGAVTVTQPFKLMERPFLRDVSFYIFAAFLAFFIFWRQEIRLVDSIGFLALYLIYIAVVLIGRYINTRNRQEIPYFNQEDDEVDNAENQITVPHHPTVTGNPPEIQLVPESPSCTSVKTNFKLFLSALNPIDLEEWKETSWFWRAFQVLKSPVNVLFTLTIPVVDKEKPRENWCQYLGILQCILGPVFSVFAINVAFDAIPGSHVQVWHITLLAGVLLALIVGFTSRSVPPRYHFLFAFAGFIISIVWIYIIANELVSLLKAFGVMFGLSDAILGLTVLAWGNSIGDMIADTSMAKRGSPRAGFSACFGGPLFNLLIGIGLPFTIQILQGGGTAIALVCNKMTLVLSVGLGVSLAFSFLVMPIRKFQATKLYGFILILIYVVFLSVCIVFEFTVMKKGDDTCF
eukprot:GFUD01038087.1.p1 GENE.GFUD01038087.1~~GFUD01038087.1.p1  ORF type:complete len:573 (+),score=74.19 GFUD01038087.1:326-2044(+)